MHRGLWRYVGVVDLLQIIKATTLGSVVFALVVLLTFGFEEFPLGVIFLDWGANILLLTGVRLFIRLLRERTQGPWFGEVMAMSDFAPFRWIGRGLVRLAALFRPEPLYAFFFRGGWDFTRMSDFQVALMPVMDHDEEGTACASGLDSCLDLGTFSGTEAVPVSVKVSAPDNTLAAVPFDVQDTRLHFFPQTGTVACPAPAGWQACGSARPSPDRSSHRLRPAPGRGSVPCFR